MNSQKLCSIVACFVMLTIAGETNQGFAQVVQLPNRGTFSVQTTVSAPDSGSTYVGGGRYSASGSTQRGPARAGGGMTLANGTSVHATIIDLNELDIMIRSQSGKKPYEPDLASDKSAIDEKEKLVMKPYKPDPPAHYAYLLAMSHSVVDEERGLDDVRYFLSLAADAKRKSQWGSVELYYQLAWKSLPESRRNAALTSLVKSRDKALDKTKEANGTNQAKANKSSSF